METLPATHIRGKCSVTLLNETESLLSYLNKDVSSMRISNSNASNAKLRLEGEVVGDTIQNFCIVSFISILLIGRVIIICEQKINQKTDFFFLSAILACSGNDEPKIGLLLLLSGVRSNAEDPAGRSRRNSCRQPLSNRCHTVVEGAQ